jgi:hypothetical protein
MAVAAISMTKVAVPIIGSSSQAAIYLPHDSGTSSAMAFRFRGGRM